MNFVFIITDTLRRDYLNCYADTAEVSGFEGGVHTPSLDALAAESTVMERCYEGSFPTMPTRSDIMTAKYCFHTYGWAPMPKGTVTLQALFRRAGYVTQLITDHVQMLAPGMNYHQGFNGHQWIRGQVGEPFITAPSTATLKCDRGKLRQPENWVDQYLRNISVRRSESDYYCAQTMAAACEWLEANRTHDRWLLYLDTFDVHEPWDPPSWFVDLYDPGYEGDQVVYPRYDRAGYLADAELRHVKALYAGEITLMDKWVGTVIDKLRHLGLWDDTCVVFTTDHGWYLGEHGYVGKHTVLDRRDGWPLYEEIGHIPLLVRVPGLPPGRCDALCQPVDLLPTLCELAGIEPPEDVHGLSFAPALHGEGGSARSIAVNSHTLRADPQWKTYSAVTDGEWTLHTPGRNRHGATPELYHLPTDPHEHDDRFGRRPDVANRLHAEYIALLEQIAAPAEKLALRGTP